MSFQSPWAWFGAIALVLPLAVHLFSKRPARTVAFPSLRFIGIARVLPTRRTQLSDLLLLALRLAIVAVAVVALAQPLFRLASITNTVARAVVLDTMPSMRDSAARGAARDTAQRLAAIAGVGLVIETATPSEAVHGATAWLSTQSGKRELFVLSDFRRDMLDSALVSKIPQSVAVHLIRVARSRSALLSADTVYDGRVRWVTRAGADVQGSVRRAVRAMGGRALAADSDSQKETATNEIVVASADADSVATWSRLAHALPASWMGDVIARMSRDTVLVSSAADATARDTVIAAPFVTIARNASGAPVVMAAALSDAATSTRQRLLIVTRAQPSQLLIASTLLSASHTIAPTVSAADTTSLSEQQLRAIEQLPRGASSAFAASVDAAHVSDYETGLSHARYLWLLVLLLLVIESVVRRRGTPLSGSSMTDTSIAGTTRIAP